MIVVVAKRIFVVVAIATARLWPSFDEIAHPSRDAPQNLLPILFVLVCFVDRLLIAGVVVPLLVLGYFGEIDFWVAAVILAVFLDNVAETAS